MFRYFQRLSQHTSRSFDIPRFSIYGLPTIKDIKNVIASITQYSRSNVLGKKVEMASGLAILRQFIPKAHDMRNEIAPCSR